MNKEYVKGYTKALEDINSYIKNLKNKEAKSMMNYIKYLKEKELKK